MAYSLVAMVVVVSLSRVRASGVFSAFSWPDPAAIARILKLGLPIGLALFVEVACFSAATLLIGRLGVETVAAHQVAFNVVGVTFMVPLALGMAATIRVGYNVGPTISRVRVERPGWPRARRWRGERASPSCC